MSRFFHAAIVFVLVAGVFVGAWAYVNRQQLVWQWACYKAGAASSFDQAKRQFAWFERGPNAEERVRVLAAKWGNGNRQFDEYLARYVTGGESSMALRQAFSEAIARQPELLQRWTHFWCWQSPLEPDRQVASILEYLDTLAFDERASGNPAITWREVLDLQAIFTVAGDVDRAARVTADTWQEHYRVWREAPQPALDRIPRPAESLPE